MKYSFLVFCLTFLFSTGALANGNALRSISSIDSKAEVETSHFKSALIEDLKGIEFVEGFDSAADDSRILSDEELEKYLFSE